MKNKILLAIFIICLAASIILAFIPAEESCGGDGDQNGCYVVAKSPYAETIGITLRDDEDPMLICWNDKARDMHSPSGVLCEFDGTPGWEVYGENHGGRWRISINNDAYVFIYG